MGITVKELRKALRGMPPTARLYLQLSFDDEGKTITTLEDETGRRLM